MIGQTVLRVKTIIREKLRVPVHGPSSRIRLHPGSRTVPAHLSTTLSKDSFSSDFSSTLSTPYLPAVSPIAQSGHSLSPKPDPALIAPDFQPSDYSCSSALSGLHSTGISSHSTGHRFDFVEPLVYDYSGTSLCPSV